MGGGGLSKYFLNLLAFISFKKLLKIEFSECEVNGGLFLGGGMEGGGEQKPDVFYLFTGRWTYN